MSSLSLDFASGDPPSMISLAENDRGDRPKFMMMTSSSFTTKNPGTAADDGRANNDSTTLFGWDEKWRDLSAATDEAAVTGYIPLPGMASNQHQQQRSSRAQQQQQRNAPVLPVPTSTDTPTTTATITPAQANLQSTVQSLVQTVHKQNAIIQQQQRKLDSMHQEFQQLSNRFSMLSAQQTKIQHDILVKKDQQQIPAPAPAPPPPTTATNDYKMVERMDDAVISSYLEQTTTNLETLFGEVERLSKQVLAMDERVTSSTKVGPTTFLQGTSNDTQMNQ